MNCPDCQQLLQERLDGLPIREPAELEKHLAGCAACRGLHAAAGRLLEGLRHLKPPAPPAGLQDVIVREVLADRQARLVFRRRLIAVSAVAAGLLLAVATMFTLVQQPTGPTIVVVPTPATPKVPDTPVVARKPSLRGSVADAGEAFVSLTRRTANETIAPTRLLVPEKVPASLPEVPAIETPMPSVWTGAGQGVSSGLEPIANSARRAFSMLRRENPDEKR